jgi:hypothetical protein
VPYFVHRVSYRLSNLLTLYYLLKCSNEVDSKFLRNYLYLLYKLVFAEGSTLQVLSQDENEIPLLYNLVFGEDALSDATLVVSFNAIQHFDLANFCRSLIHSNNLDITTLVEMEKGKCSYRLILCIMRIFVTSIDFLYI